MAYQAGTAQKSPTNRSGHFPPDFDPFAQAGGHVPNHFSVGKRITHVLLATALLVYGGLGLYWDDLVIPTKRGGTVHLHGWGAWLMFGAIACASALLLALVVDHYDRRRNEHHYESFKKTAQTFAWIFLLVALVANAVLRR